MRLISRSDDCDVEIVIRSRGCQIRGFDFVCLVGCWMCAESVAQCWRWLLGRRVSFDLTRICSEHLTQWCVAREQLQFEMPGVFLFRAHAHGAGTNGRAMPEGANGVVLF